MTCSAARAGFDPGETHRVTVAELEEARRRAGLSWQPGDVMILHTGYLEWYLKQDLATRERIAAADDNIASVGLDRGPEMLAYLWDSGIAAIGSDNPRVEAGPFDGSAEGWPFGFLHTCLIGQLGMEVNFNGWGNKQRHNHDALVARRIAALLGVPFTAADFVSEGGAIETDGHGTLMATESSIINPNRNLARTRAQLEAAMGAAYGASEVIWFTGIRGQDITDDHVDSTSRFTAAATGIVQYPRQASDHNMWSNDERCQYEVLSHAHSDHGRPIATTKLLGPTWSRIRQHRDNNFVDSYANYYVCNGAVICAQFGDAEADAQAAATIRAAFPGRVVEPLNIDALGIGGGGIHCVTQQQPAP